MFFCVYAIKNKKTGKMYIGSTENFSRRKKDHFSFLKHNKHYNKPMQEEYNQYGKENFSMEKLEEIKEHDRELLRDREQYWLNKFKPICYNICPDTRSPMKGRELSEEHKKRLSETWKGRILTEEHKKKLSVAHTGIKMNVSAEERMKRSERMKLINRKLTYKQRLKNGDKQSKTKLKIRLEKERQKEELSKTFQGILF